jgi:predicted MPP superfamily phosphohydrolase
MRGKEPIPERPTSPPLITRRRLLQTAVLSAGALGLYACEFSRHELQLTRRTMLLPNLPEPFHNFRIVQISDIHLDDFTEPIFLRHVIRHVNALAADLVLITGDFITHGPPRSLPEHAIYTCAEILKEITCPQRLACLGNHDSAVGASFIARVLRERGTPVLLNQNIPIERDGRRLWIAGVEDPASARPNLTEAMPANPDGPVILMAHAPDYADYVRSHPSGQRVDYMLSGHSHGGQVRLPIIGPMILPPMGQKYVEGYFRFGNLQLYVNRGLGAVGLPLRFDCPPEITHFTLQPA